MDEVDSTSQALMRLKDIVLTRETQAERERKQKEENEYNNLRKDMGLNNSMGDYLGAYTSW